MGPVKKFDEDPRNWSIAYQMKRLGEIKDLVTALYTCDPQDSKI